MCTFHSLYSEIKLTKLKGSHLRVLRVLATAEHVHLLDDCGDVLTKRAEDDPEVPLLQDPELLNAK